MLFGVAGAVLVLWSTMASAANLYDVKVNHLLSGTEVSLGDYTGKVLLIANVASECGYTEQGYTELNKLHDQFADQGLQVIGLPCNQFGAQEPGTPQEIDSFAKGKGVEWTVFSKIDVNGPNAHPLYQLLKQGKHSGDIAWNFEYFLVSRKGKVVARWKTGTSLVSTPVTSAIVRELGGAGTAQAQPANGGMAFDDIVLVVIAVVCLAVAFVALRTDGKKNNARPKKMM